MIWRAYGFCLFGGLLALPNSAQSAPQTADSSQSTEAVVRALLDIGFKADPGAYKQAESHWRSNRLAARRDSRVDFAWGLILRKHGKNREAERQFLTAAGRSNPKYLPARQAVAWLKFATGDTRTGLSQLEALLRDVVSGKGVSKEERIAAAKWIGSMLAALDKQSLSKRDAARVAAIQRKADRLLKGEFAKALQAGKEEAAKRSDQLDAEALKRRLVAKKQKAKRTEKRRKTIESKKTAADEREQALKRSADQWKEWLEAKEKAAKTAMAKLMKEFKILEGRRQSLMRSMLLTSQEWTRRKNSFEQALQSVDPKSPRRTFLVNSANQVLNGLEAEFASYNQRHLITLASMAAVRKRAFAVVRQFQRDSKSYETATGQLARRGKALDQWQAELKRAESRLKNQKIGGALASKVAAGKNQRASRLAVFDIEQERKRLLESLAKSKRQ